MRPDIFLQYQAEQARAEAVRRRLSAGVVRRLRAACQVAT
jgi:hypothetical protein